VKPWFEDLPLDWTREETRAAHRILQTGYDNPFAVTALAKAAGLNVAALPMMAPIQFLTHEMLDKARLADRLLTLIAEILADPNTEGQHSELRGLVAGHEVEVRDAGLHRKPSIVTLAALNPAIDVWGPTDAEPVPAAEGGFERTINLVAGFVDPAKFRLGIAWAEVRTARVEIGGKGRGTGFLIGPDLMITNWHVVEQGVDGAVARFDHSGTGEGTAVKFASEWLVAHSPHDTEANELRSDGPPEGTLDFAVVRLEKPIGDQGIGPDPDNEKADRRGHYALDWGAYEFDVKEPLLILGHPQAQPVQLSYASPAGANFTSVRNRVRYNTNTSGGSSGSPVFNQEFRVVALHHLGSRETGDNAFNQGVPIAAIGDALRTQLAGKPELTALGL
jgi:Trypsin-like peptidase domain